MTDSSTISSHPKGPTSRPAVRRVTRILSTCGPIAAVLAPGIALAASAQAIARAGGYAAASPKLMRNYKPSQSTGWEQPYTPTIGGHVASTEITYHQKKYRDALLRFGHAAKSPNVVYESVPKAPLVTFKKTLAQAWDRYYTFRYLGGLPSGAKFVIQSNSVSMGRQKVVSGAGKVSLGLHFGADVYLVYNPGSSRRHPAINSNLQFIQVVYSTRATNPTSFVDSARHNPFYGEGSGLTSINGNQIVNFYDHIDFGTGQQTLPEQIDRAETFLAQDTGTKNSAGKDIVNIYGGVEWGFEFKPVS